MMTETLNRILEKFQKRRTFWAGPVDRKEVEEVFKSMGRSGDEDYIDFVSRFGGGYVGTYPIYGLKLAESMGTVDKSSTVTQLTNTFRKRNWSGTTEWVVFTIDQSGNPIGFAEDNSVWISDAATGQIVKLAESFESFLRKWALRIDPL